MGRSKPAVSAAGPGDWPAIAMDMWLLGADACLVIGLRCARLASGGTAACDEARLMVTEKIDSSIALGAALVSGGLGHNPKAVLGATISHYRRGVSANRKRLSRRR